jgi:hypothetical protein
MFKHACSIGIEGVVSKVRDSRYASGRGNDWVKKTCAQRETLPIAGFALKENKFDGIYIGRRKGTALVYAGKVDHGFGFQPVRHRIPSHGLTLPAPISSATCRLLSVTSVAFMKCTIRLPKDFRCSSITTRLSMNPVMSQLRIRCAADRCRPTHAAGARTRRVALRSQDAAVGHFPPRAQGTS